MDSPITTNITRNGNSKGILEYVSGNGATAKVIWLQATDLPSDVLIYRMYPTISCLCLPFDVN
eukprot:11502775-Ditylum_brightwellii.AAC.1